MRRSVATPLQDLGWMMMSLTGMMSVVSWERDFLHREILTLKAEGRGLEDSGRSGQGQGPAPSRVRAPPPAGVPPDAVGGGEDPAASDEGASTVDLLLLL